MPQVEAVFLGDMHLGSPGNLFPEMADPDDLIYTAFDAALYYAKTHNITHVFLLGDIFDTPEPSQDMIVRFLRWLTRASDEFDIYFIPGNHDFESEQVTSLKVTEFFTNLDRHKRIKFFSKPKHMLVQGVPFCFLPWPHASKKAAGMPATPSVNIAHIGVVGAAMDSGRKIKEGEGRKLPTNDDIWLIGHLHRTQKIGSNIFYPGTLFQKNFGEPLPKGFIRATLKEKAGKVSIVAKFIEMAPPFVLENLRIEKPADLALVKPFDANAGIPHRYKLFVQKDVALPPDFRARNPHIVKLDGWTTKREAAALERGELALFDENDKLAFANAKDIIYRDLTPALKERGLNKAERKRARGIVDNIVQRLGIT